MELLRITLYWDDGILLKEVSPTSHHIVAILTQFIQTAHCYRASHYSLVANFLSFQNTYRLHLENFSPLS